MKAKVRNVRKAPLLRRVCAIDLFCGAGGLTHGLLDAGIEVIAGFDIDGRCRYPYEKNNSPAVFKEMSVTELTGQDLAALYPGNCLRILAGCAPCQPFSKYTQGQSSAGDDKWGLLYHFGRLVEELLPDIVSMENVPQLQDHKVYDDFNDSLKKLDYHVTPRKVYCPAYGVPQQRERLVLLASRIGPINLISRTHAPKEQRTVKSSIGKLPNLKAGEICPNDPLHRSSSLSELNAIRIGHSRPGGTWRDWPEHLVAKCHRSKTGKTYPSVYGRMEWNKPSPTITTQFYGFGNGRFGHPEQHRGISLREGAILQSFPRDYEFVKPGGEYCFKTIGRMIGNAVPVRLGQAVGKSIQRHLEKFHERIHS